MKQLIEQGEQLMYLANYWDEALKEIFAFKYCISYSLKYLLTNYKIPKEKNANTNLN